MTITISSIVFLCQSVLRYNEVMSNEVNREKVGRITGLKGKYRYYFFFLAFLTALLSIGYVMVIEKGMYFIADDYLTEQIPFTIVFGDLVKHGLDTWAWDVDLGSSTIQAFSFYGLGSPFFWATIGLSPKAILYVEGWLMIAKYVVACYSAQMFLKRFVSSPKAAIPGALLYAFSGFQCTNIVFNQFHDAVAFFPLMLVGLEVLLVKKSSYSKQLRCLFFAFVIWLNAFVNYFFFVQSTIALILYYLFRFKIFRNPKRFVSDLKIILPYAFLGVGLAMVLLVPSALFVMGNPRSDLDLGTYIYLPTRFLYMLRGWLLPADAMWAESAFEMLEWTSTSCYLPFIGHALTIAYVLKKRNWLSRLMITLCILSFFPIGNALFLLFTEDYQRWWYILVLISSLATIRVLDKPQDYPIKTATIIYAILIIMIALAGYLGDVFFKNTTIVFQPVRYALLLLSTIPGLMYCFYLMDLKIKEKLYKWITIGGISFYAIIGTIYTQYTYRIAQSTFVKNYPVMIDMANALPEIPSEYRYRNASNVLIMGSRNPNTSGIRSYSSTVSNTLFEFDDCFDFYLSHYSVDKHLYGGLAELLGGKYRFASEIDMNDPFMKEILQSGKKIQEYEVDGYKCEIYEHPASPIGFRMKQYVTSEDLHSLRVEKRGVVMLSALILNDEEGKELNLEKVDIKAFDKSLHKHKDYVTREKIHVHPMIQELVDQHTKDAVLNFTRDEKGFACDTNYDEDSVVYFSIPADEGWDIRIDGEKTKVYHSAGMITIQVPKGEHHIEGVYHTPGYRIGLIFSVISLLIWCYFLFQIKDEVLTILKIKRG